MKVATATTAARRLPAGNTAETGYETNFATIQADQSREVYLEYYKLAQTLSVAQKMGVIDITLRTSTGTVTMPVLDPKRMLSLYTEMQEMLGDKLQEMEKDILYYEDLAQKEEAADMDGTSARSQFFAHCLPMRPISDAEFNAMPAEARRLFDEQRAERVKAA